MFKISLKITKIDQKIRQIYAKISKKCVNYCKNTRPILKRRVRVLPWSTNGLCMALKLAHIIFLPLAGLVYIIHIIQFLGPFNNW